MAQPPRIRIDPASGVPAVRQIADSLRVLLVEGEPAPGTVLPSVRRLEGWLDLRHGRRAVVVPRSVPEVINEAWTEDFRNRLRGLVAQMRARGVSTDGIAAELRAMAERCCLRSRT